MERFSKFYERYERKELSAQEASDLPHCSLRSFHRKKSRYKVSGLSGVLDRRIGNIPPNKIPSDEINNTNSHL